MNFNMAQVKATRLVMLAAVLAAVAMMPARAQQVPCYFVFGDSVFDNGNNNNLTTNAKVNYSPYGIDFPNGPTGRFSNGRNIPDFIAEYLGFKDPIPPFSKSSVAQVFSGINYASGGAGILEKTSQHLGDRINLSKQIRNHLRAVTKGHVPQQRLMECIYTINIGSNDYMNNYFMSPPYSTGRQYTPDQFATYLIQLYASHLKNLYNIGARKVALFGIARIGCLPRILAQHGGGNGCVTKINDAAELFNKKLKALIEDINKSFNGAKFTYIDMFMGGDLNALGFSVMNQSCCTVEPGQDLCEVNRPVCADRRKYVFWDAVHGTEAINAVAAMGAFNGQTASPYSIKALAS